MTYEPFHFPNGKTSKLINEPDSDDDSDEEEELEYYGKPVLFGVRHKSEIFTVDTLTDTKAISSKDRMRWASAKDHLLKAIEVQPKRHLKQLNETHLKEGKKRIKERADKLEKELAA